GIYSGGNPTDTNLLNQSNAANAFQTGKLSWDFGDGATSNVWMTTHTYKSPGIYNVTLTATSATDSSKVGNITKVITVTGNKQQQPTVPMVAKPPAQPQAQPQASQIVASFNVFQATGGNPATFVFKDTSTNGPMYWSWDFGDGFGTSTVSNPTYTYQADGNYRVVMYVSN